MESKYKIARHYGCYFILNELGRSVCMCVDKKDADMVLEALNKEKGE